MSGVEVGGVGGLFLHLGRIMVGLRLNTMMRAGEELVWKVVVLFVIR